MLWFIFSIRKLPFTSKFHLIAINHPSHFSFGLLESQLGFVFKANEKSSFVIFIAVNPSTGRREKKSVLMREEDCWGFFSVRVFVWVCVFFRLVSLIKHSPIPLILSCGLKFYRCFFSKHRANRSCKVYQDVASNLYFHSS